VVTNNEFFAFGIRDSIKLSHGYLICLTAPPSQKSNNLRPLNSNDLSSCQTPCNRKQNDSNKRREKQILTRIRNERDPEHSIDRSADPLLPPKQHDTDDSCNRHRPHRDHLPTPPSTSHSAGTADFEDRSMPPAMRIRPLRDARIIRRLDEAYGVAVGINTSICPHAFLHGCFCLHKSRSRRDEGRRLVGDDWASS